MGSRPDQIDANGRSFANGPPVAARGSREARTCGSGARQERKRPRAPARDVHERSERPAGGSYRRRNGVHERRGTFSCGNELSRDERTHRVDGRGEHDGARGVQRVRPAVQLPDAGAGRSAAIDRGHPAGHRGAGPDFQGKIRAGVHGHQRQFFDRLPHDFGGGMAEMRLTEADSSGDAGIDVVASPPGKRLQNVLLLSGGEKAMTALALLIAIFRFQPSPFCILDEVDAPLDEANVGRFTRLLKEMSAQTQFIVVTHNRKTMETGSVLYGVTMQEPGVSKIVSVRWEGDEAPAPHGKKHATAAAASAA